MTLLKPAVLATALVMSAATVHAADFVFSGNIQFHNDVVRIDFRLNNDATDVKVWTDGFMDGVNFDPITSVWELPSGMNIGQNDDDDTIAPGQTYYDSGLVFSFLAAGNYAFTLTTYPNYANTDNLSGGFNFDSETPIAIGDWCQPASDDCTDQKGTFWRVNLSGADVAAVPEPGTYAMFGLGLALFACLAHRRSRA